MCWLVGPDELPYRQAADQLGLIELGDDLEVSGVIHWDARLFVSCRESEAILIFADRNPFTRLSRIVVGDMKSARDMVVDDLGRFYVADFTEKRIWRLTNVNKGSPSAADVCCWLTTVGYRPWSLATVSGKVL